MAQAREAGFHPSSPRSSSGGADSYKHEGTPDTRLTAFSPEDNSARSSKVHKSSSLGSLDPQPVRFAVKTVNSFSGTSIPIGEKDPFVSSNTAAKPEQKLSPTASAFLPFSGPVVVRGSADGIAASQKQASLTNIQPTLTPLSPHFSADLQVSRDVSLSSRSRILSEQDVRDLLLHLEQLVTPTHGTRFIHSSTSGVHVHFSDIRDAALVQKNAQVGGNDWEASCLFSADCSQQSVLPTPQSHALRHGRVVVHVTFAQNAYRTIESIEATVGSLLQAEGDVFAFQKLVFNDGIWLALLEYCDVNCAHYALAKYGDVDVEDLHISVSADKADASNVTRRETPESPMSTATNTALKDLSSSFSNLSLPRSRSQGAPMTPIRQATPNTGFQIFPQLAMYPSPQTQLGTQYILGQFPMRGHPTTPLGGSFSLLGSIYPEAISALVPLHPSDHSPQRMSPSYGSPGGRRQNAMRVSRSPYYNAATHHNHVDVNRIREGVDVRTTIMLRNIPNKVDQAMLKRIIDKSSWGKYDFMYLRIDFANDCNVGYAFINFVDPLDIIDFVNARGNQRWNCFKSDKVAEISYATIQGKDCLVQKFRNSSVMLEAPHYRPKLFFTSNGPRPELAGEEEPFPEPDNQSKMKRSCENAEHVGLFTPNAGQHFRDEQRRRRSQYDRGTRLAALEEYDFDSHLYQT